MAVIIEAEHLTIEDEQLEYRSARSPELERKLRTQSRYQSCHAKYRDAVSLTPLACVAFPNDEPENLLVLPPQTASSVQVNLNSP